MIEVTEEARKKLLEVLRAEGEENGTFRLYAAGIG
jgi:hypothetical protein